MAELTGNSHRDRESRESDSKRRPEGYKAMETVANGRPDKHKDSFLYSLFKRDGDSIREYVIETVVIPGIMDTIDGIGGIVLEGLTEAVGFIFEKNGFGSSDSSTRRSRGGRTNYRSISNKKSDRGSRRYRRYDDDDDDDCDDEEERLRYNNVRVRTRKEAEDVIFQLRERIKETGYATVANLYELTDNESEIVWTDDEKGWSKLDSADWTKTRDRRRPYLIILPKPKNVNDLR